MRVLMVVKDISLLPTLLKASCTRTYAHVHKKERVTRILCTLKIFLVYFEEAFCRTNPIIRQFFFNILRFPPTLKFHFLVQTYSDKLKEDQYFVNVQDKKNSFQF